MTIKTWLQARKVKKETRREQYVIPVPPFSLPEVVFPKSKSKSHEKPISARRWIRSDVLRNFKDSQGLLPGRKRFAMSKKDEERKEEIEKKDGVEKVPPRDNREGSVDPYTGEVEPPAPDAYRISEIVPTDPDNREGENYLMNEEDSLDKFILDADSEEVMDQIDDYTDNEEVLEDFKERQDLADGGRQKLEQKLNQHNSMDPTLSGGDVDAAWEDSVVSGEESVGGTVKTPDQDVVDELGEAVGLTYEDDEPLDYDKKVLDRDRQRWELDPSSADENEENTADEEEESPPHKA
jgi:hypothetical protein